MIEPKYGVLQTLFADRVFRIPHYQRFYSWQDRQRMDLFGDLIKLAKQDVTQHHFMATIVCYRTPETKSVGMTQYRVYDIVDGQQRLTTLIILLKCIELAMASESPDRAELAKILVKRDGHLILLQTNNANERIFNRFIREGVKPTEADIETLSDQNIVDAVDDCARFVLEWSKVRKIDDLLSLVLHRLGFVVHDTEDSRAVYTVFEVLNSRGLVVDWLDKAKSMLMGRAFELAQTPTAAEAEIKGLQDIWGQIYREIAKEDVPGEEILRVASTLHYASQASKPRSAAESIEDIRSVCKRTDSARQISDRILDVARKLSVIHGNVFLGPATDILHARILAVAILSAPEVTDAERTKLLDQWERTTFRIFGLYGKDARTKVGDYVRAAARIVAGKTYSRSYAEILDDLRRLGNEFPVTGAVSEGLFRRDCYETSPEMCRYILWKYEEYLATKLGAGATIDENEKAAIWRKRATDSVEHVFPQQPWGVPEWNGKMARPGEPAQNIAEHVGRIGNLVLLPISINQKAQAKPFDQKKALYKRHHIRMLDEVCQEADWTLAQIESREAKIIDWASRQWADL